VIYFGAFHIPCGDPPPCLPLPSYCSPVRYQPIGCLQASHNMFLSSLLLAPIRNTTVVAAWKVRIWRMRDKPNMLKKLFALWTKSSTTAHHARGVVTSMRNMGRRAASSLPSTPSPERGSTIRLSLWTRIRFCDTKCGVVSVGGPGCQIL
jgi:hypothetical protein